MLQINKDQFPQRVLSIWWLWRSAQNPIPFRTRPLNTSAPMVLCLKARESRSPPGLANTPNPFSQQTQQKAPDAEMRGGFLRSNKPTLPNKPSKPSTPPNNANTAVAIAASTARPRKVGRRQVWQPHQTVARKQMKSPRPRNAAGFLRLKAQTIVGRKATGRNRLPSHAKQSLWPSRCQSPNRNG